MSSYHKLMTSVMRQLHSIMHLSFKSVSSCHHRCQDLFSSLPQWVGRGGLVREEGRLWERGCNNHSCLKVIILASCIYSVFCPQADHKLPWVDFLEGRKPEYPETFSGGGDWLRKTVNFREEQTIARSRSPVTWLWPRRALKQNGRFIFAHYSNQLYDRLTKFSIRIIH